MNIAVSGLHRGDNPQPGPAVIRSIKRAYPDAQIIGLSYDPLESGLFNGDIDAAYAMPFPGKGAAALLSRLDAIRKDHRLDMIMPCLDAELPNYLDSTDYFKLHRIKVPIMNKLAFERRGKGKLPKLGASARVRVPKTQTANTLDTAYKACESVGYPLFLKGQYHGALRISSPSEVANAFAALCPVVVQSLVEGEDEYDVVGVGDGKGGIIASCSIRKIMVTAAGKAYGGIVVDDPVLYRHARALIKVLRWRGPFELEFVKGPHGHELIEMNPRFPAWVDFPSQLGCNLPALLIDPALPCSKCRPGMMFMRHCVDLVGHLSRLAEVH
jgi:carbamoyl-phosphate synthase large subunit